MTKYRAAQEICISGWDCGTEIELMMVVTYTMTKHYPASNDGPEEFPQPEIDRIRFFEKRVSGNVEIELPAIIGDRFIDSEGFMSWLTSEAADYEEWARDEAADARRDWLKDDGPTAA